MIKAIFLDIDGTLISKSHPRMRNEVIRYLNYVREQGILLFIASGRHSLEVDELKLAEDFEFDGYLLLNGGYCTFKNQIVYENRINEKDAKKIVNAIELNHFPALFIEKEDMYVNFVDEKVIQAQHSINTSIPRINTHVRSSQLMQIDPYVDEMDMNVIMKDVEDCKYTKWYDYAFDIVPKNGGKKAGIEKMCQFLNIDIKETVSIGDGDNDIEMFETTGYSFAMKNASENVKKHATYVCGDVDEEGIINALKQIAQIQML